MRLSQISPASGGTTYAYDEHGELVTETDARGIVMARAVDALDRVTATTYPNSELNIAYTYDDAAVPFSKGRLTRVSRHAWPIPKPSPSGTASTAGMSVPGAEPSD